MDKTNLLILDDFGLTHLDSQRLDLMEYVNWGQTWTCCNNHLQSVARTKLVWYNWKRDNCRCNSG